MAAQVGAQTAETLRNEVRQLGIEREALKVELDSVTGALTHEQAARHQDLVAIAVVESEKVGHAQRLDYRAAEVRKLADQLAQARRQFEHFQEASADQRREDKHAHEARIARTEQEAAALRANLQYGREVLAVLRSEKVQMQHTLAEQHDAAREQARKLDEATEGMTLAREIASSTQFELEMAVERLDEAHRANARLEARIAVLEGENANLKKKPAAAGPRARKTKT